MHGNRQRTVLTLATAAGLTLTSGLAAFAQTATNATEVVVGSDISWQSVVENGGFLMYVLAGLSVLTVALVIYFAVTLRPGQIAPRALRRELDEKIRSGAFVEARRACEHRPSPLGKVAMTAMTYLDEVGDVDPGVLKDVIEGEGARQAEEIQGQTQYLMDIAAIAPMIGLLGTVFGMLQAFSSVALDIAKAKPVLLAAGVSKALVTTAFGLIVGIPAMLFYAYFRRRSSKMVSVLELASMDVLTKLVSKRSK